MAQPLIQKHATPVRYNLKTLRNTPQVLDFQPMFVYFLISILLDYRIAGAAPILVDRADATQDITSPLHMKRTLFGVIWSCTSTTIICAWTSIHPNVPPPGEWKARWNRLKLMFWMIVAPELVLAWAVRQFFAARQIRDEYNRSRPGVLNKYLHDMVLI